MSKLGDQRPQFEPMDTYNNPEHQEQQEKYKTQIDQKNSRNNKMLGLLMLLTLASFVVLGLMAGGVIPIFSIPQIGFGFVETTIGIAGTGFSSMLLMGIVAGSGITKVKDRKYEYKKLPEYTGLDKSMPKKELDKDSDSNSRHNQDIPSTPGDFPLPPPTKSNSVFDRSEPLPDSTASPILTDDRLREGAREIAEGITNPPRHPGSIPIPNPGSSGRGIDV